jgi:hypothetical protein
MFNPSKAVISLTLIGLYVFAAPAGAATVAESGVADEVNSCVAEVREWVDYSDATGIRHDVVAIERRTVGYTLKISTTVFGAEEGETIRAYATECVVNGDNKPLQFSISKSS